MPVKIKLRGDYASRRVWLNDVELLPARSQAVHNHSPDGFAWGYEGSGPAQLALAIMLELNDSPDGYQSFKRRHIAKIPQMSFSLKIFLTEQEVDDEKS